jgi:tRNA nucleotidyltransferase/poly(A) polymerase
MNIIYDEVSKIINPVYLVGGSVRDIIMGKEPKDFDFCTSLSPDEIEQAIHKVGKKC